MLIGYVSDEKYLALCDVALEFVRGGESVEVRSRATGAVHADLPPGDYSVALQKPGFGPKRVELTVTEGMEPYHFRLLSDSLLGYIWPKWVRAGESAEFRLHSATRYKLELFRYGLKREFIRAVGWFDEH
ncbi:MAG: N,N-dimethylformamidase, partial [Verrucomicrobiales bacterium]|nr:N,N-dimethylformamidase [Verrucomicrobiales bacterium]